jgi:hypothetical protein
MIRCGPKRALTGQLASEGNDAKGVPHPAGLSEVELEVISCGTLARWDSTLAIGTIEILRGYTHVPEPNTVEVEMVR